MTTCCPDCQTMHRTRIESARYHADLATQLAAKSRRWNLAAMVVVAVAFALLAFRAFTS